MDYHHVFSYKASEYSNYSTQSYCFFLWMIASGYDFIKKSGPAFSQLQKQWGIMIP